LLFLKYHLNISKNKFIAIVFKNDNKF